ncbi:MAG: SDR family oxidoreductase [Actinobacteria bacterium]|nr:SDR family oxidoreductase [Actinomycetota bacterium]
MSNQSGEPQRIALVTGAGGAIGVSVVRHLADTGALVVAADVSGEAARTVAAELAARGSRVVPMPVDMSDEGQVDDLVSAIVSDHGRLDYLVNNAGITRDSTIHKMPLTHWRQVMATNLDGPFLLIRAASRHFRERAAGGRIVNISSIAAKVGTFGQANYAAAKAGMVALTKVAARELARYEVTVNAIQPGFIQTPMTDAMPPEIRDERAKASPLGRPGTTDEVAAAVAFLCSDSASYITGAVLEVTGGRGM